MAGCKPPGRALIGVVLAVAALLATAASAVDDEHMYHWKCFKSCMGTYHDEEGAAGAFDDVDVVAKDGGHHSAGDSMNGSASVSGGGKCKDDKCLNECFQDLPAHCYHQCVVTKCLSLPPFSKEKTTCLKSCCEKCFHHGPPAPGPGPKPPGPKPKPPAPTPTKPKPPPGPKPPTPKAPPPPKKPCPPGSDEVKADDNNN